MMKVALREVYGASLSKGLPLLVLILLTNDDGVYAPGLAALAEQLRRLGEVYVVAPVREQSGVGHSITYLTPLIVKEIFHGTQRWGWAVEGSPADCVKLGITQLCPQAPELVVSGINSGLNVGINVLYSGTVAAAIEGAFFGITSVAVSLEYDALEPDEHSQYHKAARLARKIIQQILQQKGPQPQLYNMNIPKAALGGTPEVCSVPMNVTRYGDSFEKRTDPWGRPYYWLTGGPPQETAEHETDLSALAKGRVALTPLDYDLTKRAVLAAMQSWQFRLDDADDDGQADEPCVAPRPVVRSRRKKQ